MDARPLGKGMQMRPPILITGCARSGTSMVAGAINLCGAFGGDMSGPNLNNKKGMFENYKIRQELAKPFLRSIGADPLGQYPLPELNGLCIPTDWKRKIEEIMQAQGYKEGPWFYKGAKSCLYWPVWSFAFPDARWVIVRRKSSDIVKSCLKTSFMRAFSNQGIQKRIGVSSEADGWLWWVRKHEERFVEMIQAGLNCKVIWPDRMVKGNYEQLYETLEWLGLPWNSEVLNFIDPKLWKARRK